MCETISKQAQSALMQHENVGDRLSRISTLWSLVWRAHRGPAEGTHVARKQLLERYGGAARRYLRKVLRDPDAADEIAQVFALQLLNGDLHGADPRRGRFRDFVKGTLFHLIADYRKQRRAWPAPLPAEDPILATTEEGWESDRQFMESWCDELLARAWESLAGIESETGQLFHTVLRYRADHPDMHSPQIAGELTAQLGRPLTAVGIRQTLHRARQKFANLLLEEVVHSLENPTPEKLEQELIELGLFDYCQPALERYDPNVPTG
jgi:RNA polymerase sigma-70 factor (ECF subfamily)